MSKKEIIDFEILKNELSENLSNEINYLISLGAVFDKCELVYDYILCFTFHLFDDKEICIFVYEYSNKFEVVEHCVDGVFKKLRGGVINV